MFETTKRFPFFNAARRPDSSNISPIVQVVSSMDGRLKGAKEEKGESVMLSLLALLCPALVAERAGQIPGQASQTTMEL